MSVSVANVLTDQYRLAEPYGKFKVACTETADAGYFRLGREAIAYGRTSAGYVQPHAADDLYDVLRAVAVGRGEAVLPFDPDEVINNLRYERYVRGARGGRHLLWGAARKTYYLFRPLMPDRFRKHLQRIYLKDWNHTPFPGWPVDRTVENIFEELLLLSLKSHGVRRIPFIWFWPHGCTACSIVTHDIETEAGRNFSLGLADLDASYGIQSAFQIVPEERYEVTPAFLESLRARGCEVNLHGLNHDGQLFRNRREFLRQVQHINRYARSYGASGFRSPVMYRNIDWYADLDFAYDMSVPNTARLEPQRGGCCTVMPYFIGDLVELPLTTTQDYLLFNVLREQSIDLWKRQIELVTEKHGLVSFNVHPDYMLSETCRELYRQLLEYLVRICAERRIWLALPGEVDKWWRQRQEMRLVNKRGEWRVTGPFSERADVAFASFKDGRIVYEISKRQPQMARSSA